MVGCQPTITGHPKYQSGFDLRIDEVVVGGDLIMLKDMGMPLKGKDGAYGDAIIHLRVRASLKERTEWWMRPVAEKTSEANTGRPVVKGKVLAVGGVGNSDM
jgi:DnaJ-class molecular chaperone